MREYVGGKLTGVICNKCGKYEDLIDDENGWNEEPYKEISLTYGYGSVLYDFNTVRFDICEHCIEEFITGFKEPAEMLEYRLVSEDGELFYRHINDEI